MNLNQTIAKTYITANKKLSGVAIFGVVLGMSIYVFMNCLVVGFDEVSYGSVFKSTPHIRLYKDFEISKSLVKDSSYLIINPKIVPNHNRIINPTSVKEIVKKYRKVKVVSPQVNTGVFYNSGKSQISGNVLGVIASDANEMFNLSSMMMEGSWEGLNSNTNGILVGIGIAEKLSLKVGDNINLNSSKGINRNLKVVGIFKSSNSKIDNGTSYVNIAAAQQLMKENSDYVTDININLYDYKDAQKTGEILSAITGYKAEGFEQSNETLMAGNKMRKIVINFISTTILLVAGFGIFNILNMTVSQKINDIAILKAMGFKGKDVVEIFVTQALAIGFIGLIGGLVMATIVISQLKKVYIGGDMGYFPIDYSLEKYVQGVFVGLIITFFAGYIPARKAAKVDPVSIFRK